MSPADLARATKSTPSAITFWLSGQTKSLKAEKAALIETSTGYNAQWIISGKGPQKINSPPDAAPDQRQSAPGPANIEQLMAGLAEYLMEMDDYARGNAADVLRRLAANPKEHARAANLFATAFQSGKRKAV